MVERAVAPSEAGRQPYRFRDVGLGGSDGDGQRSAPREAGRDGRRERAARAVRARRLDTAVREGVNAHAVEEHVDGWEARDEKLHKSWTFGDFVEAMDFVNAMAEVAEDEGHHPDFCVHFNRVDVTIWTHAIDGLSESDFILAAKLDELLGDRPR